MTQATLFNQHEFTSPTTIWQFCTVHAGVNWSKHRDLKDGKRAEACTGTNERGTCVYVDIWVRSEVES